MKKLLGMVIFVEIIIIAALLFNHESIKKTGISHGYCEDGCWKIATEYERTNWRGDVLERFEIVRDLS